MLAGLLATASGCATERADWEARRDERSAAADARAAQLRALLVDVPRGDDLVPPDERAPRLFVDGASIELDASPAARGLRFESFRDPIAATHALPEPLLEIARLEQGVLVFPGAVGEDGHPSQAPLGIALETLRIARTDLRVVTLHAPGTLTAQALERLVGALAELGTRRVDVAVAADGALATVPLAAPRLRRESDVRSPEEELADDTLLLVQVVDSGDAWVSGTGGFLGPGCEVVRGRGLPTVAAVGGAPDLVGLATCLTRARSSLDSVAGVRLLLGDHPLPVVLAVARVARTSARPERGVLLVPPLPAPVPAAPIDLELFDALTSPHD